MFNRSEVSWNQNVKGANYTDQEHTFNSKDIAKITWEQRYAVHNGQFPLKEHAFVDFSHYEETLSSENETLLSGSN